VPTRKTKTADRATSPVTVTGRPAPLALARVVEAVRLVMTKERRRIPLSMTFIGPRAMRGLNRRWKGVDRPTDVLAFTLRNPGGGPVGDVYLCPAVVRSNAARFGVPVRTELLRVVIHATLHALGHDHPDGPGRTRSAMWRKQERYLACVA